MACACKKETTAKKVYTVTTSTGQTKTYSSEVEAKAAARRTGGTMKVG